jgi:hypothetical protein
MALAKENKLIHISIKMPEGKDRKIDLEKPCTVFDLMWRLDVAPSKYALILDGKALESNQILAESMSLQCAKWIISPSDVLLRHATSAAKLPPPQAHHQPTPAALQSSTPIAPPGGLEVKS